MCHITLEVVVASCPPQDAQFNCSVDTVSTSTSVNTTNVEQQSTKLAEPLQFTATTDSTTTPINTKWNNSTTPPNSNDDHNIFSTPANQEMPLIQTFSQSPFVAGKTPLPTKVISPSPLFATPVETGAAVSDSSPVFVTPVGDTADSTESKDKQVTNDYSSTEDDKSSDVKLPSEITEGKHLKVHLF